MSDKVRFQNLKFQNKLKNASVYRRPIKKIPETPWEIFLARMGLVDWKIRVVVAFLIFGAIYLVYAPTFLTIKSVSVQGLTAEKASSLEQKILDKLHEGKVRAQHNIVFASKNGIASTVTEDFDVLTLNSIKKKFPNRIIVNVNPRMDKFMVKTETEVYIVTNDGLAAMQVPLETASTTAPGLVKINLSQDTKFKRGDRIFEKTKLDNFMQLNQQIPKAASKPLDAIEVSSTYSPDAALEIGNFKIYITLSGDISKILDNLPLLLKNLEPGKTVHYIDMRFGEKAYVCYQGAPCSQEIFAQPMSSTSTTTLMQLPNGQ